MKYKIVTDSSSNLKELKDINFSVVPLQINANGKVYTDTAELDITAMLNDIENSQFTLSTTTQAWLDAFEDADIIFGVTFTSHLSNSFETAREAKKIYEQNHPSKKVLIIDSLSAGPQVQLIISKLKELISLKKSYQEIRNTIMDYKQRTRLVFLSKELNYLPPYGRINPAIAKRATSLGYSFFGKANFEGKFISTHMFLGRKNSFKKLIKEIQDTGYKGGKLIISHTQNDKNVKKLCEILNQTFENIHVEIIKNSGLCSCYMKKSGILIGFEI